MNVIYRLSQPILVCLTLASLNANAEVVSYEIDINQTTVNFTGQDVTALTLNGGIPAPTIEANEGDTLRVTFHNRLDTEASIHWHGVLLPNDQDGVPYLTTQPIAAYSSFTYEYPVTHHGTYWYHSHTGFQEQRGIYGAIVFHPEEERVDADIDQVLVLSDWTDENPEQVLANMKRDHDYYGLKKDSVQSWWRVLQHGQEAVVNRLQANWMRMGTMDISDVGYDAFLVNGNPTTEVVAMPGQQVRLRLVNASASSYFHLSFAGGPMQIVAADGVDVQPMWVNSLMMATAETYDVIVSAPAHNRYELRATANDGTGFSSTWIGMHGNQVFAEDYQPPNPYLVSHTDHDMSSVTHEEMGGMDMSNPGNMPMAEDEHAGMDHSTMDHSSMGAMGDMDMPAVEAMPMTTGSAESMDHSAMNHGAMNEPLVSMDGVQETLGHYQNLRAVEPTSFDPALPTREVLLRLTGSMDGYRWQFNDTPLSEADRILIRRGEVVRFVLQNETMMSHPIHLHGHFFRVITDSGEYSPLKHTVNVPSMQTVIIEFAANEEKDWFFHCHNLYHMMTGMARVIRYDDFEGDPSLPGTMETSVMSEDNRMWSFANVGLFSNFGEVYAWSFNDKHEWTAEIEYDWEEETEAELQYRYRWSRFLQSYAGIDYQNEPGEKETLGVAGFHYLLPGLIESEWRIDSEGNTRLQLESEIQLTSHTEFRWKWNTDDDWRLALEYELNKEVVLTLVNDKHFDFGAGIEIRF